jgi:hypothetical protein
LYYNYDDENIGTNFASDLKLPLAGMRLGDTAEVVNTGILGDYRSSSPYYDEYARLIYLDQ